MTRKRFFILISILFVLFLVQHILIKQPSFFKNIAKGEDFSDVEINLLDGGFEPIGYYQGKEPVILLFWSVNSDPSMLTFEALPDMLDYWRDKYEFEFIAVNVGDPRQQVEEFVMAWNYQGKVGLDPDDKLVDKFAIRSVPTFIFFSIDGSLKKRWDHFDPDMKHNIRYRLDREYDTDEEEVEAGDSIIKIEDGDTTVIHGPEKVPDEPDTSEGGRNNE